MKRLLALFIVCVLCTLGGNGAFAAHGHYVNGGEGLKVGSLPPPGVYYRVYNAFYTASTYRDKKGKSTGDFRADVYSMTHRFVYSSEVEVLGGNMVFDLIVPLVYTDIRMGGVFKDSRFGVGDILIEPLMIGWHGDRWDGALALGIYLPTGYFDYEEQASPGKGFWTAMFSAGGTVFFDDARSWHASTVARYEIHTKQQKSDITPGHDFHFEWGVGKTFPSQFELGVVGYCAWQVTDDSGRRSNNNRQDAYAVGLEVGFALQDLGLHVSLRTLREFENRTGSEGFMNSLVLTKSF